LNFIWRWSEKFPGSTYLDPQIVTYSVNKNENLSLAATPEASSDKSMMLVHEANVPMKYHW
jgi:hypothetical protein